MDLFVIQTVLIFPILEKITHCKFFKNHFTETYIIIAVDDEFALLLCS